MISLWMLAASAAPDLDRYPLQAEVVLGGPARVHVPLALRSIADPADGTDLLLVDGNGEPVPFARLQGQPAGLVEVELGTAATVDPTRYVLSAADRVDRLQVVLPVGVPTAQVTVVPDRGEPLPPQLVWSFDGVQRLEVEVPGLTGRFEVRVEPTTPGQLAEAAPTFVAYRARGSGAPVERVEVAVGLPRPQENGWVRWVAEVRPPRAWQRATIVTPETQLDRIAGIGVLPWNDPDSFSLVYERSPDTQEPVRRRTLRNGQVAEDLTVPSTTVVGDHLALYVESNGKPIPEVTGLVLETDGVELVVLEPGPNPHTLYAGAFPGTSPVWDLGTAWEIARDVDEVVEPGPSTANPAWIPPEVRADLGEPGTPVTEADFRWKRPVTGAPGLSRIALPPEVLVEARPGLPDLRLVTEGRQIPFVQRPRLEEVRLAGVTTERTENGATSELRVHLPEDNLPVVWLSLSTPAETFRRVVQVYRPGAEAPVPLRSMSWEGTGREQRVTLQIPGPVSADLLITIDNGDNPPLPLGELEVVTDGRELLAVLPSTPVELWYGSAKVDAPFYDLASLSVGDLEQRASAVAELGPAAATHRPPLSLVDRVLLAIGLGAFALGLLVLVVDTLRKLPPETAAPETEPVGG